ncbi:hypothetical protein GF374_02535 [Candidatus Woesearchaeota archaeon]|nr:hypothetical protein [Candidatus Woesearchaeota archaeon]
MTVDKGYFITLYGINNLGKTTQAQKLVKWFNKKEFEAEYLKYPIYDLEPSGPILNEQLRGKKGQTLSEEKLQMWFTFNRLHYEPSLKEKLNAGKIIVAEDYIGTCFAWGSAKGVELDFLKTINEPLLKEDLSILFQGTRFRKGIEPNHIHEGNDYLIDTVCKEVHNDLGKEYGWYTIDANQPEDKVFNDLLAIVKRELKI